MDMRNRFTYMTVSILVVLAGGTAGFYYLGRIAGAEPTVLDSVYQTIITLATVGSREMSALSQVWYGEIFIILLILSGIGVLGLFATSVTAFFIEGEMRDVFRRRKMEKTLQRLQDHIIVCGAGETGSHIIRELLVTGNDLVIVDPDEEQIKRIVKEHQGRVVPFVVAPATDEKALERAGLLRARGLVVALRDDRDNLFVVVTARQINPKLRIIARTNEASLEDRLRRAGADAVVSPSRIGGMRMASEMLRPHVVGFLDGMMHDTKEPWRIEEISLRAGCPMVDRPLRETELLGARDMLVLAIRPPEGEAYLYNPAPDHLLRAGSTLVVLASATSAHRLQTQL